MVGNKNKTIRYTLLYVFATIVLLIMIYPYMYMIFNSFAPWDQVDKRFIPTTFTLRSYKWLFLGSKDTVPRPWLRAFFNSVIVTACSTFLMMIIAMLVSYVLSKVQFRGKKFLKNLVLFQMFYPAIILLIPIFLIIRKLGIYDTYLGMILPKAVSLWAIFLYTNFFMGIPNEVIEAAKIDGASDLRIVFKIIVPMAKSITTIIFLFLVMDRWTELMWDMLAVHNQKLLTLNVLLAQMFGPYGAYPGPMYAGSVVLTFPILILFIAFSKNFKEGVKFVLK